MVQQPTILSGGAIRAEDIAKALGPDVIKALSDLLSRHPRVRRGLRLQEVLDALGIGRSAFYDGIQRGIYPGPCKTDENSKNSVWWDDEIAAIQQRAIARRDATSKASA